IEFRPGGCKIRLMTHFCHWLMLTALVSFGSTLMAQTNQTDAARWLAKAQMAPAFTPPGTKVAWEKKREVVRSQLWELLGKLPPRPRSPKIEILSREERDGYLVEKFQFENHAGATVPGYVLLPKNLAGKAPAILYCHWQGG